MPPDSSVYPDFPESAEEGRRIVVENPDGVFNFYQYVRGMWKPIAAASGQSLVAYDTINANHLTINDLDLDADGIYKIIVKARDGTASGSVAGIRFNNDAGTNYYTRESIGGASATANQTLIPFLNSYSGSAPTQYQSEILINKTPGGYPVVQFQSTGATDGSTFPNIAVGSAVYNSTDNITSITFLNADGTTVHTWDVWIYKLETS